MPIHELAKVFPETGPEDYERIKQDMRDNGQQVPAWIYQGELLDGRTRQKVAKEEGMMLAVREWQGPGSALAFVLSLNLHRRHLNEGQRAMVAANIKTHFEEEARQRKRAGKALDLRANLPEGRPRKRAAKLLRVSPRTVETASKVIKRGSPELVQAVQEGMVSVAAAAALTELPPEEQAQTLEDGKKAIKAQVKQLRQRKAGPRPDVSAVSPDRRVIHKPQDAEQRKATAGMLWDFLGRRDCLAMARRWMARAARGRRATSKAPDRSKPGRRTRRR